MREPRSKVLPLVVLVAAVVGSIAVGQGAAASVQTITFVVPDSSSSFNFVDNRPLQGNPEREPPTAGDFFVGSQKLFLRNGKRAGTLGFFCVLVTGGENGRIECTGSYGLRGGSIFVQAAFVGDQPPRIAITGGTRAYEGVRGSVRSRETKTGTVDTVRLIRG